MSFTKQIKTEDGLKKMDIPKDRQESLSCVLPLPDVPWVVVSPSVKGQIWLIVCEYAWYMYHDRVRSIVHVKSILFVNVGVKLILIVNTKFI